jgi:CRISPR-associated endonuclease Csn1
MDLLSIEGETLKKLISAVKVTGWSKYSKKALTEVLGAKAEGGKEKRTILETLEQSTDTLYTILGPDYTFFETFKKENAATLKQMEIGDVIDRITANPILRRSMNQTAHILNDIRRAYGKDVGTVYINMYLPANERALSMTALRRKLLVALRKAQKKSFADLLDALKEINMRQYLWFSQLGTDIYTGEDIPYAEIGNGEKWTVDHIYPQSRVYDNTYNNLCLTHRDTNRDKSNQYPIAEEIRNKMERFWKTLLSMELITSAKYDALLSSYFDMDKAFETADKILIEKRIMALEYEALISRILPDVKVVHVNKLLLNDFKKSSPAFLYRNAEIFENDKALDAYYTVLVGRTWHTIFGDYPKRYMRQNKQYTLNVYNVKTDAWDPSASLKKAEEVVTALNPVQTQMVDTNTQGELFNTMRISGFAAARSKVRKAPVKQGKEDVAKYGGYLSIKAAYFCLIQHGEGIVTLENVKIMDLPKIKGDDDLIKYFEEKGYKNVSIVKRKLGSYTPLCVGGNKCYITSGESGRIRYWNAIPFMMKPSEMRTYLLKIGYLSGRTKQFDKKEVERCTRPELKAISKDKNLRLFNEICETLKMIYACRTNGGTSVDKIFEQKKEFEKLDAFTQCRVLINITKFGQRKMQGTDLREIGLAKLFGIDTLSIHFKPGMNVSLLEESATGMYFKQEQIQQ